MFITVDQIFLWNILTIKKNIFPFSLRLQDAVGNGQEIESDVNSNSKRVK